MNSALVTALLTQVLIPEVMTAIRAHRNATGGKMPTDAEVLAALDLDADRVIAIGEAWLKANPPRN